MGVAAVTACRAANRQRFCVGELTARRDPDA